MITLDIPALMSALSRSCSRNMPHDISPAERNIIKCLMCNGPVNIDLSSFCQDDVLKLCNNFDDIRKEFVFINDFQKKLRRLSPCFLVDIEYI